MLTARIAEGDAAPGYERHRPEETLLYQIIEQHYPRFLSELEAQGRSLPGYVRDEFEAFLECGRLEHGFLRVRCEDCKHEHLVAFSCKRRGICPSCGAPGVWSKVRPSWWMMYFLANPYVSGY